MTDEARAEKRARAAERKARWRAGRKAGRTDDDGMWITAAALRASREDVIALARNLSPNAMRVLALIAATGKSETARVAAAAKIIEIDRASRNADSPVLAPLGKKEMALEAARLAAQAVDWGEDLQPPGYKN
jgi:hypothetical protein